MIGTTNYRKDDETSEVEQKSLTLIRVKVEDPAQNADHARGILIMDYHPRGFLISD